MSNSILSYNGQNISQRADGYVNATEVAKFNNVRLNDWLILSGTQSYISVVSQQTGIPAHSLVIKITDGFPAKTNTWLHPLVMLMFAQWISAEEIKIYDIIILV